MSSRGSDIIILQRKLSHRPVHATTLGQARQTCPLQDVQGGPHRSPHDSQRDRLEAFRGEISTSAKYRKRKDEEHSKTGSVERTRNQVRGNVLFIKCMRYIIRERVDQAHNGYILPQLLCALEFFQAFKILFLSPNAAP